MTDWMKLPMQSSETEESADRGRRAFTVGLVAAAALAPMVTWAEAPTITVWTGPSCTCCGDWIAHLEANGFRVRRHDGGNGEARARLGMPVTYGSCHTGEIAGYAIEGHVPASEVQRLLAERPDAVGLAVPAMPIGAPGMDGPAYGTRRDPYDVLLVARDGNASVYRAYR